MMPKKQSFRLLKLMRILITALNLPQESNQILISGRMSVNIDSQLKIPASKKRQRNHDKFPAELTDPKSFSSRHVEHGLKYKPISLKEYKK